MTTVLVAAGAFVAGHLFGAWALEKGKASLAALWAKVKAKLPGSP